MCPKIIGVFPEPRSSLRLARRDLDRFQNCPDHDRRKRAGVDVGMRVEAKIIERLGTARDKSAQRAECFRERAVDERNAILDSENFGGAAAILAARQH